MPQRVYFIDLETHCFGPCNMAPPIVCMSWREIGTTTTELALWPDARNALRGMLREALDGQAVIAGHGVAYDFACIIAHDEGLAPMVWKAYAADRIECTAVREKLLDIKDGRMGKSRRYSLDKICQRRFDRALDKGEDGWRLRYSELARVPVSDWPARAREYAKDDSTWGMKVYEDQERRMKASGYTCPTQHLDSRSSFALKLTGIWGVTTDRGRALKLKEEMQISMKNLRGPLISAGFLREENPTGDFFGHPADFRKDMKAIRRAVAETWPLGLGPVPLTKGGQISTGEDTIELCEHPALKALVEYSSLQKQGSTYVEALLQPVIHSNFNELVRSGRTSCSKINLQNQPRLPGVRECFVARPGTVLIASDFDSQEMRTLADAQLRIAGHSKLAELYQKDVHFDPHQAFADGTGDTRQHSKIANFSIPGGMGAKGLVKYAKGYGQTWSVEFSSSILKKYFDWYPEMTAFFGFVRSVVGPASCGNLTIPQSGMICGAVGYCDASNRLFQTPAAHASKDAHFEVVRRCFDELLESPLLGSRPWNFVHDEIILETPDFAVEAVIPEIERVMVEAMQPWVPDVPCSAAATAMLQWSKNAEHTKDSHGKIVPWDDRREHNDH